MAKITQVQLDEAFAKAIEMGQVSVVLEASLEVVSEDDTIVVPPDDDVTVLPVEVTANNVGHARVNLVHDRKKNAKGFPIWIIQEPRIQYENGWKIMVWPERIKGDSDKYAYAVASGAGTGFFVLEEDIVG